MIKIDTNLVCPKCKKKITDKDLKHLRCTKCKKDFTIKFVERAE